MKFYLLIFFAIYLNSQIFSQILSEEFKKTIENAQIEYKSSPLLIESKLHSSIIKNDIAFKHANEDFYVLYHIQKYNKIGVHQENKFISRDENGNPIDQHIADFQKTVFDVFSDEYFDYSLFDSIAVKKEFNADWGASSHFTLKPESFHGLKHCTLVVLYKKDVAAIYIYYISNTREKFNEIMTPLFYNFRFKE